MSGNKEVVITVEIYEHPCHRYTIHTFLVSYTTKWFLVYSKMLLPGQEGVSRAGVYVSDVGNLVLILTQPGPPH